MTTLETYILSSGTTRNELVTELDQRDTGIACIARFIEPNVLLKSLQLGCDEAAQVLLNAGVDPNYADKNGRTALHEATCFGMTSVTRALIENGADIDARDIDGNTPLHCAAEHGDREGIVLFLEAGADINEVNPLTGETALHVAIKQNDAVTVRFLVQRGASLSVTNREGKRAIQIARDAHWNIDPELRIVEFLSSIEFTREAALKREADRKAAEEVRKQKAAARKAKRQAREAAKQVEPAPLNGTANGSAHRNGTTSVVEEEVVQDHVAEVPAENALPKTAPPEQEAMKPPLPPEAFEQDGPPRGVRLQRLVRHLERGVETDEKTIKRVERAAARKRKRLGQLRKLQETQVDEKFPQERHGMSRRESGRLPKHGKRWGRQQGQGVDLWLKD